MNPARASDAASIDVLIASPVAASATEAARAQPDRPLAPARDAFTRLLRRLEPDPAALRAEARPLLRPAAGVPVLDGATLAKPRARSIGLVRRRRPGNHRAVVSGTHLITALWSDGGRLYPTGYRVSDRASDGRTKNDHFADRPAAAPARGFRPRAVPFDGWRSSPENLRRARDRGWAFVTRSKGNRKVRVDRGEWTAVGSRPAAASGAAARLPGYGGVKVFRAAAPDGGATRRAANDPGMGEGTRLAFAELSWGAEEYRRGLRQFTGVERCLVRSGRGQRNHVGCALRAFVRPEYQRFAAGVRGPRPSGPSSGGPSASTSGDPSTGYQSQQLRKA